MNITEIFPILRNMTKKVNKNEKILILRAEQGSDVLTEKLDTAELHYTDVKIYDIRVDDDKRKDAMAITARDTSWYSYRDTIF